MGAESGMFRNIARMASVLRTESELAKMPEAVRALAESDINADIASKISKAEAGAAKAGTAPGRVGIRQSEANALKAQTIARSGEEGWRGLVSESRARLEEGGQFPLRASIEPKVGGGGRVRPLRQEMGRPVPFEQSVREQMGRRYGEAQAGDYMRRARPQIMAGTRETIAERATTQEVGLRRAISGAEAPSSRAAVRAERRAAREQVESGTTRGVQGSVESTTAIPNPAKGKENLTEYNKITRAIQSGVVRAVPAAAAGGYAAQSYGEIAGTYLGPDSSHRNPQVQWGRNRQ